MGDYMKIHFGNYGNMTVNSPISANNIVVPREGEMVVVTGTNIERRVTKVTYEYQNTQSVEINVYTEDQDANSKE